MSHAPTFWAQNDPEATVFLEGQHWPIIVEVLSDLFVKGLLIGPRSDVHKRFVIALPIRIHMPGNVGKIFLAKRLAQKLPNKARSILDY
jgi:hypothetical protein